MRTILIYPGVYVAPERHATEAGVVMESRSPRKGEGWTGGPVILSWADVLHDGQESRDGRNLVLHEFAHQLDLLNDGEADGTPPLPDKAACARWHQVLTAEFERLKSDCRSGGPSLLDAYGASNPAEFFAVVTECFFERPAAMSTRLPDLYDLLCNFYRQNPVNWLGDPQRNRPRPG